MNMITVSMIIIIVIITIIICGGLHVSNLGLWLPVSIHPFGAVSHHKLPCLCIGLATITAQFYQAGRGLLFAFCFKGDATSQPDGGGARIDAQRNLRAAAPH